MHLHAHTNSYHAHMQPAPVARRLIKACADSRSSAVRSATDFVMVTNHSPLTLLRRWPCTPHSHPAQLVAGARDTVAGGTRRVTRVAAAPLGHWSSLFRAFLDFRGFLPAGAPAVD